MISNLRSTIFTLVFDDDGQDLVEYALLTAAVGIAGVVVYAAIRDNMALAYNNWTNPATPGSLQYNWVPDPPLS